MRRRLRVVVEAAERLHRQVQRLLPGVAERRVPKVVRQRQRLGEVLVQPQRAGDRAGDLRHLDRMGQPGAVEIALVVDEHLGLVLQFSKCRGVDDAVAVALPGRARGRLRLRVQPAATGLGAHGVGRRDAMARAYTGATRASNPRAERPMFTVMGQVAVTDRAARRIAEIAAAEGRWRAARRGARGRLQRLPVPLRAGQTPPQDDDLVIEQAGAKVLIDPASLDLLAGAELDYAEELMGSHFAVQQPERQVGLRLRDQLLGRLRPGTALAASTHGPAAVLSAARRRCTAERAEHAEKSAWHFARSALAILCALCALCGGSCFLVGTPRNSQSHLQKAGRMAKIGQCGCSTAASSGTALAPSAGPHCGAATREANMVHATRRAFTRLGMLLTAASALPPRAGAAGGPGAHRLPLSAERQRRLGRERLPRRRSRSRSTSSTIHTRSSAKLPLAATAGLPGLGGRKVEAVSPTTRATPPRHRARRCGDHPGESRGLAGCYQSSCTLTASAVAERYGIPFMAPEFASPNLTERGFKWFFRTTPIGTDFGIAYADFLVEQKSKGTQVEHVAVVNENTEYGTSTGDAIIQAVKAKGLKVDLRIPYNANASDVSAQVLQLKNANPDVVIFISYTSDSILFLKTMHNLGHKPPIVIGDDFGFSDHTFVEAVSELAQGAMNRSSFDVGKPGSVPYLVNAMFHKASGHDMDDTSARGMQGFLALMEAINRAGSTEPAKIQAGAALAGPEAGPVDDRLQGHQVRCARPEHAGVDVVGAAFRQAVPRGVAGQFGRADAGTAVQGVELGETFTTQARRQIACAWRAAPTPGASDPCGNHRSTFAVRAPARHGGRGLPGAVLCAAARNVAPRSTQSAQKIASALRPLRALRWTLLPSGAAP